MEELLGDKTSRAWWLTGYSQRKGMGSEGEDTFQISAEEPMFRGEPSLEMRSQGRTRFGWSDGSACIASSFLCLFFFSLIPRVNSQNLLDLPRGVSRKLFEMICDSTVLDFKFPNSPGLKIPEKKIYKFKRSLHKLKFLKEGSPVGEGPL